MKLSKKAITILLSIFAVLCSYLFIEHIVLFARYVEYFCAWGIFPGSRYTIVYALTSITLLISIAFSTYYLIAAIKGKKLKNKIEKMHYLIAAIKGKKLKNKIEKMQHQLDKLSNDREDESI